jgi:hypothetical protein
MWDKGWRHELGIKHMVRPKQWTRTTRTTRPAAADDLEKQAIIAACKTFIRDVLTPRFLPEIRPSEWNYVIGIHGAWMAGRYRFMQRYRSGMEHNLGEEFDAPFARIDSRGRDRFDIYWMRHTGKLEPVHAAVTLAEALRLLETDKVLHPV